MQGDHAVAARRISERVEVVAALGKDLPVPIETVADHGGSVAGGVLKHCHLTKGRVGARAGRADHRVSGGTSRRDRDAAARSRCRRPLIVGGAARLQDDTGPLTNRVCRNRDSDLWHCLDGHIQLERQHRGVPYICDMQLILAGMSSTYIRNVHKRICRDGSPSTGTRPIVCGSRQRILARQHQSVALTNRFIVGEGYKQVAVCGGGGILIHEIERDGSMLSAIIRDEEQIPLTLLGIGDKTPFRGLGGIAAVNHIPARITPHIVLMVAIGGMVAAVSVRAQSIVPVAKLIHKIILAARDKRSPAYEIHIQSGPGGAYLLDIDEQIPGIINLHIIPSRIGSGEQTGILGRS